VADVKVSDMTRIRQMAPKKKSDTRLFSGSNEEIQHAEFRKDDHLAGTDAAGR
jgi:hypothetical protein